MSQGHSNDAYAASVIARIDPAIRSGFSDVQEKAIYDALSASAGKSHLIDIRRVLPLYFMSFYIVFLVGRDRRMGRRRVEYDRRERATLFGNVIFFIFAVSPLVVFLMLGLYFLKAALGIDLFPNFHLPNLFGMGRG